MPSSPYGPCRTGNITSRPRPGERDVAVTLRRVDERRSTMSIVSSPGRARKCTSRVGRSARAASTRVCSITSAADVADGRTIGQHPAAVLLDADRRPARSAGDRDWRRPPPPTPATLRARRNGRRRARQREVVSRTWSCRGPGVPGRAPRKSAENCRVVYRSESGVLVRRDRTRRSRAARPPDARRTASSRRRRSCRSARAAPSRP